MGTQTVLGLLVQLQNLENLKMKLQAELSQHMFQNEIRSIADDFSFDTDGERLAVAISERDFPLTRTEIVEIFETSGFEFTNSDIEACNPNSDDKTQEYRDEEMSQYVSIYGFQK